MRRTAAPFAVHRSSTKNQLTHRTGRLVLGLAEQHARTVLDERLRQSTHHQQLRQRRIVRRRRTISLHDAKASKTRASATSMCLGSSLMNISKAAVVFLVAVAAFTLSAVSSASITQVVSGNS